jgi:glycosyltransferase involved in cell wall biosynthesis
MPTLSILVPSLNERENLAALVSRVRPVLDAEDGELVVVDDGSTDGSTDELARLASTESRLIVRRHERRRGIPQAWSTALTVARGEWVASLDADLQYEPTDLQRLLAQARSRRIDFVQGARQRIESEGALRHALSRGLNAALNVTFGTQAHDHKSALFVCRHEHLAKLLTQRHRLRHWQCFIGVSARALGLSCDELPVSFKARKRGVSAFGAIPWRSTLEVMADFAPALRLYGRRNER